MKMILFVVLVMYALPGWPESQVSVVGLFSGRALLMINGKGPQNLAVGQTSQEGVKLVSADSTQAIVEVDGKLRTLVMGQGVSVGSHDAQGNGAQSVTLYSNQDGHFLGDGSINGYPVKFILDTGATSVTMSSAQARRIGLDYLSGQAGYSATAAGTVKAWGVSLNSVKMGAMVLNQVPGVVIEGDNPPLVLLGMSALNRLEMKRDGIAMTLIKKY
jgi:aspartyl protease family protein